MDSDKQKVFEIMKSVYPRKLGDDNMYTSTESIKKLINGESVSMDGFYTDDKSVTTNCSLYIEVSEDGSAKVSCAASEIISTEYTMPEYSTIISYLRMRFEDEDKRSSENTNYKGVNSDKGMVKKYLEKYSSSIACTDEHVYDDSFYKTWGKILKGTPRSMCEPIYALELDQTDDGEVDFYAGVLVNSTCDENVQVIISLPFETYTAIFSDFEWLAYQSILLAIYKETLLDVQGKEYVEEFDSRYKK